MYGDYTSWGFRGCIPGAQVGFQESPVMRSIWLITSLLERRCPILTSGVLSMNFCLARRTDLSQ